MNLYSKSPSEESIQPYQILKDMIEGEVDTVLLNLALDVANLKIMSYLNIPKKEFNPLDYEFATVLTALDFYNYKKSDLSKGISSITQGQRSISYNNSFSNFELSEEVKALLPKPRVGLL